MKHQTKKPRPKPVTTDDYRRDRDYWKNRANVQQRLVDSCKNREYQAENDKAALVESRNYFRAELQKLCPHDKPERFGGLNRCARCKKALGRSNNKKRSETT